MQILIFFMHSIARYSCSGFRTVGIIMHPPSTMRRGLCRPLRLSFFLP